MGKTKVIVTIEKDKKENITEIVKRLEEKNAVVEEQLPVLNRIICAVEESDMKDLESVPGVKKVDKEKIFKTQ